MFRLSNDIELVKQFMESYNLWAPNQRKQISDNVSMSSQISMSTQPSTSPLQIESFKTVTLNAEETDTIDLANRVLRIEENMNNYSNRFARIEKCLNLNSDDDNSKITTIEDSLVYIKTFVDKLKNLLTHGETLTIILYLLSSSSYDSNDCTFLLLCDFSTLKKWLRLFILSQQDKRTIQQKV